MITRRSFITKSAAAAAAAVISPSILGRDKTLTVPPAPDSVLNGKRVLYVWGGWMGHDPDKCRDIFVPWLESEGAKVLVSDTLDAYLENDLKSDIDLVIQAWTMGTIDPKQENALLKAVKNGTGIAGWHGGLGDSFRNNPEYQFMVGGQWVAHPGGVVDYRVNIVDQNDPVTKGLKDFDMHSEQYYVHVDPNVKVLATTTFPDTYADWIGGCIMPVVWKKVYGKGRVFYSSLAHVVGDFDVPEALEIMKRGIRWASLSKFEPMEEWKQPVYKDHGKRKF
jgi:type 1 glutamine amidotransferase